MIGFEFVYLLLLAELVLVSILLLPLPDAVLSLVLKPLSVINNPIAWVLCAIYSYFVYVEYGVMREKEDDWALRRKDVDFATQMKLAEQKFRSERNFYLVSFTLAMMIIFFRLNSMLHRRVNKPKVQ